MQLRLGATDFPADPTVDPQLRGGVAARQKALNAGQIATFRGHAEDDDGLPQAP